jgi:hypothetical protein
VEAFVILHDFAVMRSVNLIDKYISTLSCPLLSVLQTPKVTVPVPSPLQLTLLVAYRTWERYTVSTMTARENNANSW